MATPQSRGRRRRPSTPHRPPSTASARHPSPRALAGFAASTTRGPRPGVWSKQSRGAVPSGSRASNSLPATRRASPGSMHHQKPRGPRRSGRQTTPGRQTVRPTPRQVRLRMVPPRASWLRAMHPRKWPTPRRHMRRRTAQRSQATRSAWPPRVDAQPVLAQCQTHNGGAHAQPATLPRGGRPPIAWPGRQTRAAP